MPSMTRIAGRVNVGLIARIMWTGPRVLSIDLSWKEGRQAMASFDDVVDRGYSAQGPVPCAILIRFRLNELATFADPSKQSEAGCFTHRSIFLCDPVRTTNNASDQRSTIYAKVYF